MTHCFLVFFHILGILDIFGSRLLLVFLSFFLGLDFDCINNNNFGAVSKAAYRGHMNALKWMLIDKTGPSLLWQLKKVPDVKKKFVTMEELMEDGGYSRVSEFLKVNSAECSRRKR